MVEPMKLRQLEPNPILIFGVADPLQYDDTAELWTLLRDHWQSLELSDLEGINAFFLTPYGYWYLFPILLQSYEEDRTFAAYTITTIVGYPYHERDIAFVREILGLLGPDEIREARPIVLEAASRCKAEGHWLDLEMAATLWGTSSHTKDTQHLADYASDDIV